MERMKKVLRFIKLHYASISFRIKIFISSLHRTKPSRDVPFSSSSSSFTIAFFFVCSERAREEKSFDYCFVFWFILKKFFIFFFIPHFFVISSELIEIYDVHNE